MKVSKEDKKIHKTFVKLLERLEATNSQDTYDDVSEAMTAWTLEMEVKYELSWYDGLADEFEVEVD